MGPLGSRKPRKTAPWPVMPGMVSRNGSLLGFRFSLMLLLMGKWNGRVVAVYIIARL